MIRKVFIFILMIHSLLLTSHVAIAGDTIYTPGRFAFSWANDFPYQTDYYYSNGFQLTLDMEFMERSPFNMLMLPHYENSQRWYGMSLSHEFFTPKDIYTDEIQEGDRPYSAVLMLGNRKVSQHYAKRITIISEIGIGLMGKYAGGKQLQNGIHDILWTSRPAGGWHNQVGSALCIQYNASISKGFRPLEYLSIDLTGGVRAGIPYTDITPEVSMVLGKINDQHINRGVDPGAWECYLVGGFRTSLVLYNATIQGGVFNNDSPYTTQTEPVTYSWNAGIGLSYKLLKLELYHHWTSPEFVGADDHRWAEMNLYIGF